MGTFHHQSTLASLRTPFECRRNVIAVAGAALMVMSLIKGRGHVRFVSAANIGASSIDPIDWANKVNFEVNIELKRGGGQCQQCQSVALSLPRADATLFLTKTLPFPP